ncbi:hypothetical protein JTB14_030664 [Gonioctena quinquepunctata]|nr:hypothetical protein JTB14_030664 [Gonioctena quinquepunctata]
MLEDAPTANNPNHTSSNNTVLTEEGFLKEENKLLRQIIRDKDVIIDDKETIIQLQNDKIASLENRLKQFSIGNSSNNSSILTKNAVITEPDKITKYGHLAIEETANKKHIPRTEIKQINEASSSVTGKSNIQGDAKIQAEKIGADNMQIQTRQKMDEIINLTNNTEAVETDDFTEESWQDVYYNHESEIAFDIFFKKNYALFNDAFPVKTLSSGKNKPNPWITTTLIEEGAFLREIHHLMIRILRTNIKP